MNRLEQSAIAVPYSGRQQEPQIEEMETIRPGRPKPFFEVVVEVVAIFYVLLTVGLCLVVYGVLYAMESPDLIIALLIAAGIAALLCVPVAYWRVGIYDDQQTMSSDWKKFKVQEKRPEPKAMPYIYKTMGQAESIVIGDFRFTEKQWRRLAGMLEKNDWKVTRKPLGDSGLFPNVNDNYQGYISDFVRVGWLPDGSAGNEKLTEDGVGWFERFAPPTPSRTGVTTGGTGTTTTTTTATTGEEWE